MPTHAPAPRVRPPQQARSQETLDRLLDAAEALLEDHRLEELTVRDIVAKAAVTTGSFYARFTDKDSCIHAMFERFLARAMEGDRTLVPLEATNRLIRHLTRAIVRSYRTHRGLLAALVSQVQAQPTSDIARLVQTQQRDATRHIVEFLLKRRAEIRHPRPERAARFAVALMLHSLRDAILVGPPKLHIDLSDREFADELTAALLRYLGFDRA